jgi:hypothetical protein
MKRRDHVELIDGRRWPGIIVATFADHTGGRVHGSGMLPACCASIRQTNCV